ncbi:hypothetical protein JCM6882_001086 [Rhodosporidiobolus microsporus]
MNNPNLPVPPSTGGGGAGGGVPAPSSSYAPSVLLLLILSFWVSYYLKVRRIRSVHETIVAMFAGMFVGALVRLSPGHVVQSMIAFRSTILLNVLLPPIILNSGYMLKQENFFRNFAVILSFAFAGTFISAVALGVIVYLYSLLGLEGLSLTMVECLLFGSTLSATDPVTILAIFNAMHVDPKLYSIIFGESILNDAVAIVMFETLSQFHGEKVHVLSFFHGVGIFLLTFFTSMALGVCFGLGCSLMLKHSELGRYTEIEACLVLLIAYTSYFFSNALTMSGIVSLLFCGITLKHYAYHNMSHRTQRTTRYLFGSLAQLSENFIFIYLGLSLFTQTELVYKPMFIIVTAVRALSFPSILPPTLTLPLALVWLGSGVVWVRFAQIAVCLARYSAVFPISKLINLVFHRARGQRHDEIPHSYRVMLFWAGLRGAVGVALAQGLKGEHAATLQTTCLVAVVLTTVLFGGTIQRMVEILGIRTGVDDGEGEDDSSEDEATGGYRLAGMGEGMGLEGAEAGGAGPGGGGGGGRRHTKRRSEPVNAASSYRNGGGGGGGGRNGRYVSAERERRDHRERERDRDAYEFDTSGTVSPLDSPYRDEVRRSAAGGGGVRAGGNSLRAPSRFNLGSTSRGAAGSAYGGARGGPGGLSPGGSEVETSSEDSDSRDELPLAAGAGAVAGGLAPGGAGGDLAEGLGRVWRDGQWFQVLDEKFLIPVFSNATASRKQASKKALRAKRNSFAIGESASGGRSGDEADGSSSPYQLSSSGAGGVGNKSFTDILSSLVAPALTSSGGSPSPSPTGAAGPSIARAASAPAPSSSSHTSSSHTSTPLAPLSAASYASPNSPMPSVDLSTAPLGTTTSAESRPGPRARGSGSGQHTPQGSFGGTSTPVMPFGPGRRSSVLMAQGGSGSGNGTEGGGGEGR